MKKKNKFFLFIFILFILISFVISYHIKNDDSFVFAAREEEKTALEKELAELEALILQYQRDITKTEAEKQSLQHQINTIKRQIDGLALQIRQSNLAIQRLGLQIQDTEESIIETSLKIEDLGVNLTDILRAINEEDKKSYVEIMLMGNNLSDFFDNVLYLEILNSRNKDILLGIKNLKAQLENQKINLGGEKGDLEKTVKIQALQKQESEAARRNQENFLKMTEAQYQQYLKEKEELEKRAAEIRSKIFQLAGISTTDAPTFGEALEIAKDVERRTGTRPALLLAILQQESALGSNVGQCYIADKISGNSVNINNNRKFTQGIHPTRDLPGFLQITQELGKDSLKTPISCTMVANGKEVGWGGAMGPAQFIPSTWMMYKDRLQQMLGRAPNPWLVQDSFLASGLLLSDSGARSQTKEGEWRAAMIYFSGSTTKSSFFWYADQVLVKANCVQSFIDTNTMSTECQRLIRLN